MEVVLDLILAARWWFGARTSVFWLVKRTTRGDGHNGLALCAVFSTLLSAGGGPNSAAAVAETFTAA